MNITKRQEVKKQNIIQFALLIAIIIMINIVGRYVFTRIDLTTEKRYSLSKNTKDLVRNLDDVVFIKVYLDGDLPAHYKKLRNETRIMLNEFRSYGKAKIQFEFIDITEGKDRRATFQITEELRSKGIQPIVDTDQSGSEVSQRIIIPGAIAIYREREVPIQLLVNVMGGANNKEMMINQSIQALEFKLADAIRKLTAQFKPGVAFLEGYGGLSRVETSEAERILSEYYRIERKTINGQLNALNGFQGIILAKPDSAISDKDKFIIDQFIMKGGKALFLIDPVFAEMDSLREKDQSISYPKRLNLEDMFFKWGFRINTDLLMDVSAVPIPIITGMVGNQPEYKFYNWPYFPMIISKNNHPIVKNINPVKLEFVSSIDDVSGYGINKTPLLTTSRFTRRISTPATIKLGTINETPDRKLFNRSELTVSMLLEGEFESVFHNRIPIEIAEDPEINFRNKSIPTKMIVVSDGDIIKNQFVWRDGRYIVYPLGYDRFTQTTFGNADFLLNAMSYLLDENNLLDIRSREIKIRLLDKDRVEKEKFKWQFINLVFPILILVIIGFIYNSLRKRVY